MEKEEIKSRLEKQFYPKIELFKVCNASNSEVTMREIGGKEEEGPFNGLPGSTIWSVYGQFRYYVLSFIFEGTCMEEATDKAK